jgi:ankyrin repeat protein
MTARFENSVPQFKSFMEVVRTDDTNAIKAFHRENRYSHLFHDIDQMTALHTAIKEARPENVVEALLDLGSDPGCVEVISGVTPFQTATIVTKSRKTRAIYSRQLLLKMLQSPSSLDFTKRKRKYNVINRK